MTNSLDSELLAAEQAMSTDSYSMSIGELISSYVGGEIEVNPAFQRFFRWTDFQKSRLIESFLLGLPVPPIFVYQRTSGHWELIDGLQRVSTILQFVGELKNKSGDLIDPLTLTETKYMPSLKGMIWKETPDNLKVLPDALKLKFRKARIDVKIIMPKSAELSKYELFDRLNTGGSQATSAEVRNCLILMKDASFFEWLSDLVDHPSFVNSIPLTERAEAEQYRIELLVRFLILQDTSVEEAKAIPDLETYLNDKILEMASNPNLDRKEIADKFRKTFDLLFNIFDEGSFRRLNIAKGAHVGPFLLAAFEVIAMGVAKNLDNVVAKGDVWLEERIKQLWEKELIVKSIGLSSSRRLGQTIPLGRSHFQ
ncbi:DUF262 domain-containing protein [Janthinobacterium sp. SUN098]|uniref:DUF262 domain-containing protein n=1 Tax=Janthinobacterium sp. SUN098 TaxID=3002437 RepID=UPI0038D3AA73